VTRLDDGKRIKVVEVLPLADLDTEKLNIIPSIMDIVKTFEEVCEITFVNQMYDTASEHSKTLPGTSAD
jgi:hypothetical protein